MQGKAGFDGDCKSKVAKCLSPESRSPVRGWQESCEVSRVTLLALFSIMYKIIEYNNVYNCIQCIKFLVVSNRTHSVSFPYVNILSSPYFSELKHPFEAKPCDFPGTSAFSLSVMFRYQDHGCKDRSYIKGKMRWFVLEQGMSDCVLWTHTCLHLVTVLRSIFYMDTLKHMIETSCRQGYHKADKSLLWPSDVYLMTF